MERGGRRDGGREEGECDVKILMTASSILVLLNTITHPHTNSVIHLLPQGGGVVGVNGLLLNMGQARSWK